MKDNIIKAVYIYPGWHKEPFRRNDRGEVLDEWGLLKKAGPKFAGHRQPRKPLKIYDDSLIESAEWQISLAKEYNINAFIYCFYWSFGRRVLYRPLDEAFLGSNINTRINFAIMWANRMPRGILPIKSTKGAILHPSRFVYTNKEDFLSLIKFAAQNYFVRPNYLRILGKNLFLIFDSTFFLRDTGVEEGRRIILSAREWLKGNRFDDIFLVALNPAPAFMTSYKKAGFDAISHYVFLPEWKGEFLQEYETLITKRASEWDTFAIESGLPYFPSVSPGWDATPRGIQNKDIRVRRYPYWPVVINESPDRFKRFLNLAKIYNEKKNPERILFITSMNEYTEGHYIEPDSDFGYSFLEAVRDV
ncbi:MAG: glycoside hydrolase family 99-like domain-containing protein [Myxococcota bacterium]